MPARLVLAMLLATALAGCGSSDGPRLDRNDVAPLLALASRIAADGPCAQKRDLAALSTRATGLINRHAVPPRLQEQFMAAVNDVASRPCGAAGVGGHDQPQQARNLVAWLRRYSR